MMTTREKKLYFFVAILSVIIASILFSYRALEPETQAESERNLQGSEGKDQLIEKVSQPIPARTGQIQNEHQDKPAVKEELQTIVVDVKGFVQQPGVYEMKEGDRIIDAIQKAGDVKEEGTLEVINLAQKVTDGMVIYVPGQEEVKSGQDQPSTPYLSTGNGFSADSEPHTGKININTATAEELEQLPGIGPSRAQAIVEYRDKHGKFTSKEQLRNVPGIGAKIYEQFVDRIDI